MIGIIAMYPCLGMIATYPCLDMIAMYLYLGMIAMYPYLGMIAVCPCCWTFRRNHEPQPLVLSEQIVFLALFSFLQQQIGQLASVRL